VFSTTSLLNFANSNHIEQFIYMERETAIRKCHLCSKLVIRHTWFTLLSLKDDQNTIVTTRPFSLPCK